VAGFFEYLQDIIIALFIRNPQELERRRALRSLYDEVRKVRPLYYRRSNRQVLPNFGVSVLNLALVLRPLREVFEKTVSNPDHKLAQRYKDYLVKSFPAEKIHMIPYPYHPLEPGDKEKARKNLGFRSDEKIVFSFGFRQSNIVSVLPSLKDICQCRLHLHHDRQKYILFQWLQEAHAYNA